MGQIPGVRVASWNQKSFARFVMYARETFGPTFVAQRIPHRHGALQEQTGNMPRRAVYDLNFAGLSWADDAREVLGGFVARPRGELVHHLWGPQRMVVLPIDATWDPVREGTRLAATVTFEEDTLTNNVAFDRTPGAVAEDLSVSADASDAAATNFSADVFARFKVGIPALQLRVQTTAAVSVNTTFTSSARSFSDAALSQFQNGRLQPTLAAMLNALPAQLDAAHVAVRRLPVVSPYMQVCLASSEQVMHQAALLDAAIRANLPPPIRFTVKATTTLFTLVGRLYPTRSKENRIKLLEQVVLDNQLERPDALQVGQLLTLPAP